jgi:hypothetical protein
MSWLRTIKWNERSLGTPLESKVCTHTPLLSANGVHGLVPGQQRNATVISPGGSVAMPGAADGGDKGAVADIAGEEDLVDALVQFGGAQNIATADETSIALDDPPEFPDATALYPPP